MSEGRKDGKYYELVTITLKNDREEHNRLVKERKQELNKVRAAERAEKRANSRSRSRSKGRGKQKKEKDPNKPKGKKTAWIFYSMDMRPAIKKKNPDMSMTDITKVMAKKWAKETDQVKRRYDKMAKKDARRWEEQMKVYNKNKDKETTTTTTTRSKRRSSSRSKNDTTVDETSSSTS